MGRTCKTPAGTGVSRDRLGGSSRRELTAFNLQSQFLIAAHHVRPEIAAALASIAFGGAHG